MERVILVLLLASMSFGCGWGSSAGGSGSDESVSTDAVEADEAAGLQAVRDIRQAQANFLAVNRRYAQFISELEDSAMLPADPEWAASGYAVQLRGTSAADGYSVTANPPEGADARSFFVDQTGVIRVELGEAATAESLPLESGADDDPEAP